MFSQYGYLFSRYLWYWCYSVCLPKQEATRAARCCGWEKLTYLWAQQKQLCFCCPCIFLSLPSLPCQQAAPRLLPPVVSWVKGWWWSRWLLLTPPSVWGQGQAAACLTRPDAAPLQNGHPALVPGWLWVFPKPPKTSQLPALSSARPACNPAAKQQGYISGKAWKSSKTAKFQGDLWGFITKPQVKASANDSNRELMGQMIGSCWCLRGPESCCNGNGEDFPCNEGISLLLTCSWLESNQ